MHDLIFPRLIKGTLIKRYKRFMADIKLKKGHIITAHCPNSGSMLNCSEPGRPVYLSRPNNPKRRLRYTWEIIEMPRSLVGINTLVPNRLVKEAIIQGRLRDFLDYETVRSEVPYGQNSRIDLLLEKGDKKCFIEIKNCTLVEDGIAYFPDAVTSRGLRHLLELEHIVSEKKRGVMFYLVQRMDAKAFKPAFHIDPAYAKALKHAAMHGVEVMIYDVTLDLKGISLRNRLPYRLSE